MMPVFLVLGHAILVLLQTICLWISPKTYVGLANSIFTSIVMFVSGLSFPLLELINIKGLVYVLPTNALVQIPSKILFHKFSPSIQISEREILLLLISSLLLAFVLYGLARALNHLLRRKNHA